MKRGAIRPLQMKRARRKRAFKMKRRRRRRRKKALKNTAELLLGEEKERGQEKVMKSKIEDLKEKREAAHERR